MVLIPIIRIIETEFRLKDTAKAETNTKREENSSKAHDKMGSLKDADIIQGTSECVMYNGESCTTVVPCTTMSHIHR